LPDAAAFDNVTALIGQRVLPIQSAVRRANRFSNLIEVPND